MDRVQLAKDLAVKAGEIVLQWYEKENEIIEKGDKDFALSADIEAEKLILGEIKKNFPNDSILSEEAGAISDSSGYRWVVDPLDGTANFKARIPYFCTPIALEENGKVIMSVVYDPLRKNLYTAEKGKGAYLNNQKLEASREQNIAKFLFSYSTSKHKSKEVIELGSKLFRNMLLQGRAVRLQGSSVLDLCNLASGVFDGLIKVGASYWDYAPGCLIVEEAGGVVTSIDGRPWGTDTEDIVGSNNTHHAELLKILSE